jgi:hypothetical protein
VSWSGEEVGAVSEEFPVGWDSTGGWIKFVSIAWLEEKAWELCMPFTSGIFGEAKSLDGEISTVLVKAMSGVESMLVSSRLEFEVLPKKIDS